MSARVFYSFVEWCVPKCSSSHKTASEISCSLCFLEWVDFLRIGQSIASSRLAWGELKGVHRRPITYRLDKHISTMMLVIKITKGFGSSLQFKTDSCAPDAHQWHQCYCSPPNIGGWRLRPRQGLWQLPAPLPASTTMLGTWGMPGKCWLAASLSAGQVASPLPLCAAGKGLHREAACSLPPLALELRCGSIELGPGQCEWQHGTDHRVTTFFRSLPAFLKQTALWIFSSSRMSSFPETL